MPPTVVTMPDGSEVEFPDGMADVDIQAAVRRLSPPASPSALESLKAFGRGAWRTFNPIPGIAEMGRALFTPPDMTREPYAAIGGPIGLAASRLAGPLWEAHKATAAKGAEAFQRGDILEGVRHSVDAAIPLVGPALDRATDLLQEGQYAEGAGELTGLTAGAALPALLPKARVPALARNPNPLEARAVAFGERRGIPVDAATATGNPYVKALQHGVDRSLAGSLVNRATGAEQAGQEGLARVGRELTEQAAPGVPVTRETAGEAVQTALQRKAAHFKGQADQAYGRLRAIEADPASQRTVATTESPGLALGETPRDFAPKGASDEAVWHGVLADARRQGFTGSDAELRVAFNERLRDARDLFGETAAAEAEYGDAALLKAIRERGGLRPYYKGMWQGKRGGKFRGDFEDIVSGFTNKLGWSQRGGSSIFRTQGLALDDLVQQLNTDPRWADLTPNDLLDQLDTIARRGPRDASTFDQQHYLDAAGVRPGQAWWAEGDVSFDPAAEAASSTRGTTQMALPVDLRAVKAALRPVYEQLSRQLPITRKQASPGYTALENVISGPDFAPLSQADRDLSAIKDLARRQGGVSKLAVRAMDEAVRTAATQSGGSVLDLLTTGRAATVEKYAVGDIAKKLRQEPVKAFTQLLANEDAGVKYLRQVATYAPDELPKLGRAYLADLLDTATAEGSFGKGGTVANAWQRLGDQTKTLLFKDPAYIQDLDDFFRLARKMTDNPNPSGTAQVLLAMGQGGWVLADPLSGVASQLASGTLAKLLHSRRGVRALTRGLQPAASRAQAVAASTELAALLRGSTATVPAAAGADRTTSREGRSPAATR